MSIKYKVSSIQYKTLIGRAALLIILNTLYLILYTSVSNAQQPLSSRVVTIVPPTFQKPFQPGETTDGIMKVINDSTEPITFTVSIQDFIVVDNNGTPNLLPPDTLSGKYSAASWIGVNPTTFTVSPGERKELSFFVQVPPDARPGGHYAAAVYTPINEAGVRGSGATVTTQLGTLFSIDVAGPITERAEVVKFQAVNKFQEYGPVKIQTEVKNFGDLHIRPNGNLKVVSTRGRVEIQGIQTTNIFPGSSRIYENTVGKKLMVGRYEAKLLASYGRDNNIPLVATMYFWVFPWRVALVVLLAIATVILGFMLWKKRKGSNTPPSTRDVTNASQSVL